jgi:LuxR family maltose regulon positive regulatory protein
VLRARLLAEEPREVPALHRRASAWFADRSLVEDAVRHALAAEDFRRAAHLMEEALPEVRRARRDGLLITWSRALPDPVVRRSPVLSIVRAWSLLMSGDLDSVGSWLDDAEAALDAGAGDPALAATWADTEDLRTARATVPVYRASLAQARGDVAGTVRHARHALELAGPDDHFVRGAAGGFLGLAAWARGDVGEALATFSAAVRSLHAAGNLVDELDSTVVLADMLLALGRPDRARRLYEQALHAATAGGPPFPRATADLHVGLAELDRELNDLPSAEAHLESARVLGERASITENRHRYYLVLAQVRAARGDYEAATQLLAEAEARYRPGFYPDIRPLAATRARVRIAGGDLDWAVGWVEDRSIGAGAEPDYLHEYEHLTLVRLLLAQQRAGHHLDGNVVLALLDRLDAAATRAGRNGSVREIRMLQALAHAARGDGSEALAALGRSLVGLPEPGSYVRLYLDEGVAMLALLQQVAHRGGDAARAHAERLLRSGRTFEEAADEPRETGGDPLSSRELQVLRLLDSELTGPEIARELYVTINTLRTHTKRIFTKLHVTTRAAAVRAAQERGLL